MRICLFAVALALGCLAMPAAAQTTYNGAGFAIPDNDPAGAGSTINVADSYSVSTLHVTVVFGPEHPFAGDLIATLTKGATTVDLFRQVGWITASPGPGDSSNLSGSYRFIDSATNRLIDVARTVGDLQTITPGDFRATTNTFNGNGDPNFTGETVVSLTGAFAGSNVNGAWTLNIADIAFGDEGSVQSWSLTVTPVPEPSLVLVGGGAMAAVAIARHRRSRRKPTVEVASAESNPDPTDDNEQDAID